MREAVREQRVKAAISQRDLESAARGGIVEHSGFQIRTYIAPGGSFPGLSLFIRFHDSTVYRNKTEGGIELPPFIY
ncbi:hypothetical protein FACS1894211_03380 [Clostridia bacterium]|nr:hypothetical protein FACS1894211_03380 [Clostridia bacterium]